MKEKTRKEEWKEAHDNLKLQFSKEKTLSEKVINNELHVDQVKQFIKEVLEEIEGHIGSEDLKQIIEKKAGDLK